MTSDYRVTVQGVRDTYSSQRANDLSKQVAMAMAEQWVGDDAEFFSEGADEHKVIGYRGVRGVAYVTR